MASPRLKTAGKAFLSIAIPTTPIALWYKNARDDRAEIKDLVDTKIRIPNVQTVDDLLVEKCRPGDVVLFDRRIDRCAAGPLAALSCALNRLALCDEGGRRAIETGKFDHCGLVVPGRGEFDPVMLLESTAGEGIIARPLLTRLEMSSSRTVTLLPLSAPNERREDDDRETPAGLLRLRERAEQELSSFRDRAEDSSRDVRFWWLHSLCSIVGAVSHALGLQSFSPSPVSPAAWTVVMGLQACGVAENITGREALDAKVEDFLRDFRFVENDAVRLRPGWKIMRPVTMRENSSS